MACEGVEVYLHSFWTSALGGRDWLASFAGRFIPGERAVGGPQYRSGLLEKNLLLLLRIELGALVI